jgi:hypothetical protein
MDVGRPHYLSCCEVLELIVALVARQTSTFADDKFTSWTLQRTLILDCCVCGLNPLGLWVQERLPLWMPLQLPHPLDIN